MGDHWMGMTFAASVSAGVKGMKTLLKAIAYVAMGTIAHADDGKSDAAPFGLRYGMQQSEVPLSKLPDDVEVDVMTDVLRNEWGKKKIRNPMLAQCEQAFDGLGLLTMVDTNWVDWVLQTPRPLNDFADYDALEDGELVPKPTVEEVLAGMSFTGPVLDETRFQPGFKQEQQRREEKAKPCAPTRARKR